MTKSQKSVEVEHVIVGAGAAGLFALQTLLEKGVNSKDIVVLESGPHVGGRAKSALHLMDAETSESYPLLTTSLLAPIRIRWEREWVPFSGVKWDSKDWVAHLPQWSCLNNALKTLLLELPQNALLKESEVKFCFQTPVSALDRSDSGEVWELSTPSVSYKTPNVYWAAGLKSFQNACGKHEAQKYLVSNESYDSVAADFRGGIGLDLILPKNVEWEEGLEPDAIIGLPLRFEGKLHLIVAVLHEEDSSLVLKTLTHTHQDLLSDPKLVSSFQKALRRGLKSLFKNGELPSHSDERWVVSDRVLGHRLGTPWLLNAEHGDKGLLFVGDESSVVKGQDTLGAFESVRKQLNS
jgi:hypothetical protein